MVLFSSALQSTGVVPDTRTRLWCPSYQSVFVTSPCKEQDSSSWRLRFQLIASPLFHSLFLVILGRFWIVERSELKYGRKRRTAYYKNIRLYPHVEEETWEECVIYESPKTVALLKLVPTILKVTIPRHRIYSTN
jgi:hypothetical protein